MRCNAPFIWTFQIDREGGKDLIKRNTEMTQKLLSVCGVKK